MGKSKDWLDSLNSKGPEVLKAEFDNAQPWEPSRDQATTVGSNEQETIPQTLAACGFNQLQAGAPVEAMEPLLRALASRVSGADRLRRAAVREATVKRLQMIGVSAPANLVDAALRPRLPDDQVTPAALYQRARREKLKQAAEAAR
ncbi:MAG: hypothetical protein HY648_04885 [Acidobacteria bacterium]|nr:hypothetical protein [Acidobacteriota bacterium]